MEVVVFTTVWQWTDTAHMDTQDEFSRQASLVLLGQYFRDLGLWSVVEHHVRLKQKMRQHRPLEKLLDVLVTILAGGQGVVECNTRVRPERAVQLAFGRQHCAEQSTISRTLNACTPETVAQLRTALDTILRQHGHCYRHDYTQSLQVLDIDVTGLVAGRQGEGVTKGYFAHQRNKRGRQLGRVLASRYGELVTDQLYPGQRQLEAGFPALVLATEKTLELTADQRRQTLVRTDGGAGTDANIRWVLPRGYHVLTKLHSWARAAGLAATVTQWYPDDQVADRELGWVTHPIGYGVPTRQIALRTPKTTPSEPSDWRYHGLVTTLPDASLFELLGQPPPPTSDPATVLRAIAHVYDQRDGALETANRDDKQGLGLAHRNKRAFAAQEMLILLAELAHNLTIWARRRLGDYDPRFQKFGIQRLVRDVFQIGGQATISPEQQVIKVVLNPRHPYAEAVERAFGR